MRKKEKVYVAIEIRVFIREKFDLFTLRTFEYRFKFYN